MLCVRGIPKAICYVLWVYPKAICYVLRVCKAGGEWPLRYYQPFIPHHCVEAIGSLQAILWYVNRGVERTKRMIKPQSLQPTSWSFNALCVSLATDAIFLACTCSEDVHVVRMWPASHRCVLHMLSPKSQFVAHLNRYRKWYSLAYGGWGEKELNITWLS